MPKSGLSHAAAAYERDLSARATVIDRDTETALARRARAGDTIARDKLTRANLKLVVAIAREFQRPHLDNSDIVQEGNIGLLRAIEKFDPERGVKLATYAAWWIRAAILNYVSSTGPAVQLKYAAQRAVTYRARHGASDEVTEARTAQYAGATKQALSFDHPHVANGGSWEVLRLHEVLPDGQPPIDEVVAESAMRQRLQVALAKLGPAFNEREKELLEKRLLAVYPRALADIGRDWGVSRERVRQIEDRLLGKLRHEITDA